ncbi:NAD(P)-binding protein [Dothidotthia symphoricarpi CBS 119687]|uniref:NAD(P)-binding protein n=1 Tax=Dothidotthia symphoricarpi CBS 119687 TaxID=1392245 RepID=A0A6A6A7Z2_9PLEO|nr:NAD(P)-binding protein [Dothidotthia symphoricarpi CBS 119687]KAF2127325.1 NAD(P)-binding protein [Dothidotthia symphoricarpi CBS 119687]
MTNVAKEIVLVTGANSGIGFEIAHQFLARGTYHVLLGSRSLQKGTTALQDLQSRKLPGSIELLTLDIQSDDHIAQATTSITQNHGKLDILINNAGIAIPSGTEREQMQIAFDTNATGPYLLTQALIPLLRKSSNPRVINISSGAGSIGRRLFPESPMYKIQAVQYRASKTALNMITTCQYVEYGLDFQAPEEAKGKRIKVWAYDPGFTVSNLGSHNKKEFGARSAEETVVSIMDVVDGKRDDEQGQFIHNTGGYPW